jgi:hypothetical protein
MNIPTGPLEGPDLEWLRALLRRLSNEYNTAIEVFDPEHRVRGPGGAPLMGLYYRALQHGQLRGVQTGGEEGKIFFLAPGALFSEWINGDLESFAARNGEGAPYRFWGPGDGPLAWYQVGTAWATSADTLDGYRDDYDACVEWHHDYLRDLRSEAAEHARDRAAGLEWVPALERPEVSTAETLAPLTEDELEIWAPWPEPTRADAIELMAAGEGGSAPPPRRPRARVRVRRYRAGLLHRCHARGDPPVSRVRGRRRH